MGLRERITRRPDQTGQALGGPNAFVPEVRLAARVVVAAPPDDLFSAAKPDSGEPEDAA